MSQECTDVNDRNNDLVNNNCQQWQKIDPKGIEVEGSEGQHQSVYNGKEGGKNFAGNNGSDMTSRSGDGQSKRKLGNIEERIESSVSSEGKDRISNILTEVSRLSDIEKLLLYLKLPTGSATEDVLRQTPTSVLHSSNRVEQAQAFTWIRSHLEEDSEICVPKHEVYDDYKEYCDSHDKKFLCPADFGKVMKCVFPNVKARRLGQRGQSRYCYSGLRKKLEVQPPSLPELEVSPRKLKDEGNEEDELFLASCQLVCEWAQKLLGSQFSSLGELSEYLVGNHYVNSKSMAAFTVLAAMQESGTNNSKVPVSMLFSSPSNGNKHRETQIQLQRKLQEREILKEQKKILQQQKYENEQEHEQFLQTKGLNLSHKNMKQSFLGKGAARDISKLLQSPSKDSCRNGRRSLSETLSNELHTAAIDGQNNVDLPVLNPAMQKTTEANESIIMCSDNSALANREKDCHTLTSYHNPFNNVSSLNTSVSADSSQPPYSSVVQKPTVIQLIGQKSEENRNNVRCESQAMDTNEKENDITQYSNYTICVDSAMSNENSIIILPSTPSTRSAFVPVSNQRKDSAFSSDPSLTHGVTLTEKIQNDQELQYESHKSENVQHADSSFAGLKNDLSGQPVSTAAPSKSLSPQTPRKSKNRFTPIKPKMTSTKLTSSQKPPMEAPTYDSRPVAAILKERRAKEAKEVRPQFTAIPAPQVPSTGGNIAGSLPVVAPQILRFPASAAGTKPSDVLIILGSSSQQNMPTKSSSSIISPCQNVSNTAITNTSAQSDIVPQTVSKSNPGILTFYPTNQNVVSRSSISSKITSAIDSTTTVVSSQDYTRQNQNITNVSHSSQLISHIEVAESLSDHGVCNEIDRISSSNVTMVDVSRKENDTPSRKRKCSDQGSVLATKKLNSMELRDENKVENTDKGTVRGNRSISYNGKLTSKNTTKVDSIPTESQVQNLNSRLNLESLEHDALLDSHSIPVENNLCQAVGKNSRKETSSIGINAKSLRPSKKQLMKEKIQLDERIHNFLNKLVDPEPKEQAKKVEEVVKKPDKPKQGTCHPVNLLSLLQQPIKLDNPNLFRSIQQTKKTANPVEPPQLPKSTETKTSVDYIHNRRNEDFTQSKIAELLGRPKKRKEKEVEKDKEKDKVSRVECVETLDKLDTRCSYNEGADESELPTDVAEFVTEALTARTQSRASNYSAEGGNDQSINDSNLSGRNDGTHEEAQWVEPSNVMIKLTSAQEKDSQEHFIVPNTPPIRQSRPDNSNSKHKSQYVQRSASMPVFAVPSKPQAPLMHVVSQSNGRMEVVSPVNVQMPSSPHEFTSPQRKTMRRPRQSSSDNFKSQTPISDAGYHSFNASPVMNSTPLPLNEVTQVSDSTNNFHYGRSESSHSIMAEAQTVSPISHASPRPSATSTPSSVLSPHCLSQGSINHSPVEYMGSPNAFMPIQGIGTAAGSLINPRIVTPIRPVVTLAEPSSTGTSAASATANQLLNIMKRAPGLTKAALQTHQRLLAQQLDPSGFVSLNPPSFNNHFANNMNGETVPPNLSLINTIRLQSESPIQRSPSVSCSTPDDDMIIVSPKPKENISHQRSTASSRPATMKEIPTLPTYEEALRQIGRTSTSKQHNVRDAAPVKTAPVAQATSDSSQLLTRILTEETKPQESSEEPVLSKAYPFSYQLALLHEKIQTPSSKQSSDPDKAFYDNITELIRTLDSPTQLVIPASTTEANPSCQTVSGKILIDSRSEDLNKPQTQFTSEFPANGQAPVDSLSGAYPAYDLPNVNYIGSAPNIDLSSILHKSSSKPTPVFCDSNQSLIRPAINDNTIQTNGIKDDDLPAYMDIFSLGGQYFSKAELDVENLHSTLPTSSEAGSAEQPHYRSETLSS